MRISMPLFATIRVAAQSILDQIYAGAMDKCRMAAKAYRSSGAYSDKGQTKVTSSLHSKVLIVKHPRIERAGICVCVERKVFQIKTACFHSAEFVKHKCDGESSGTLHWSHAHAAQAACT